MDAINIYLNTFFMGNGLLFISRCYYSSLRASIGFILTARCAGISPIKVPKVTMIANAPRTKDIGTVGLV